MNRILITTIYPGSSPRDVELNVTRPIEAEMAATEGVKEYLSLSREGLSVVDIRIDDDATPDRVRQIYNDIQQGIDGIDEFPEDLERPPVLDLISSGDAPIVEVALRNQAGMNRDHVDDLVKKLEKVAGVARCEVSGMSDTEIQVLVEPDRALENQVGLRSIAESIQRRNRQGSGGDLESFVGEKKIVSYSRYTSREEIRETIIRMGFGGNGVRLKDIAEVEERSEDTGLIVRNDGNPGVSISIIMKEGADILDTVEGVHQVLAAAIHPAGLEYSFLNDQSRLTRDRLSLVISNAIMGFILVVLVLFSIFNLRTSLWTAFGIPFSLLGVFILLYWLGYTLNVLTLGGFIIVLGMLVDDAIVVAEEINSQRETGKPPMEAALTAVQNVWKPVFASALTTMIAFTPLLSLGGLPGKFIWLIPLVVILALVVSLFESYFILPAHLSHGKTSKLHESEVIRKVEVFYTRTLHFALGNRYSVIILAFIVLLLTVGLSFNYLKKDPFPQEAAEGLTLRLTFPLGSSLAFTSEQVEKAERILLSLPDTEIAGISSRIGTHSSSPTEDLGSMDNGAIIFVHLAPYGERSRTAAQIGDDIRSQIENAFQAQEFEYLVELMRIGPPLGRPFEIRLASNEEEVRAAESLRLQKYLRKIPGVLEVEDDTIAGKNELNLVPDHQLLAQAGLTVEDILTVLRISFDGMVVSSMTDVEGSKNIRLRLDQPARADPEFLKRLPISNKTGQMVRANRLMTLHEREAPGEIRHVDGVRTTTIFGNLDAEIISPEELMEMVRSDYEPISKVHMDFSGQPEETRIIFKNLQSAALFAGLGIYLVIALIFQSFFRPLVVLLALPFVLPGVLGALVAHGLPVSIFTGLAVIGLMGVVVNGSIVMVYTVLNGGSGNEAPDRDTIISGAVSRLRPLLLTTFTTVLGLFPTAYSLGGYDPFITPMCLALAYGLLLGTFVILVMVPVFLAVESDIRKIISGRNSLWVSEESREL